MTQHEDENEHAVEVEALSAGSGDDDVSVEISVLDGPRHKEDDVEEGEEEDEDDKNVVIFHVRLGQLIRHQLLQFGNDRGMLGLRFCRNQPSVDAEKSRGK